MITVSVSVTNPELYSSRLQKSLEIEKRITNFNIIKTDPNLPYSSSRNTIQKIETDYILFCHEDIVFLENGRFIEKIEHMCNQIPDLGIGGILGFNTIIGKKNKLLRKRYGALWLTWCILDKDEPTRIEIKKKQRRDIYWNCSFNYGRFHETKFEVIRPEIVETIDDPIAIIPKKVWNNLKYDDKTFPFHLSTADYCMMIKDKFDLNSYVLPLQIWRIESFSKYYYPTTRESIIKFREKWLDKLPVSTILGVISND
jgi:hypothetical protein